LYNNAEAITYPNPTQDILNIKIPSGFSSKTTMIYRISDLRGVILDAGSVASSNGTSFAISVENLQAGCYLLYLNDIEKAVISKFTIID